MLRVFSRGIAVLPLSLKREVIQNHIITFNSRPVIFPSTVLSCNRVSFYSTKQYDEDYEFKPPNVHEIRKMYVRPVDWLPFEWHRRKRHNPFENSGDLVKELEYDPSWPKPDFELSDELKTASDDVKKLFTLATAKKDEIKEAIRRRILKKVQRHPNDFDSQEVKIALYTIRIRSLFQHQREIKKERRGGRVILYTLICRRNKKLKQLYRLDRDRFNWLTQELGLEFTPRASGKPAEKYCKKWALRQLVKIYSKKILKKKKNMYHEELKQQQAEFLKEKEEILAWIEKEEKELANLTI